MLGIKVTYGQLFGYSLANWQKKAQRQSITEATRQIVEDYSKLR
jgi:hypothetical protein